MVRVRIGRRPEPARRPPRLRRLPPGRGGRYLAGSTTAASHDLASGPREWEGGEPVPAGFDPLAEFDTAEDVDVLFHITRRASFGTAAAFAAITLGTAALGVLWPLWYERPLWGGMTLHFIALTVGLPVAYVLLGWIYRHRIDRLENQIMGRWDGEDS